MSNAKPSSLTRQLLTDLQGYFVRQPATHYPTEQLLNYLAAIENAPWATFAQGKAITARHLARLLQPYGIAPKTIRFADGLAKGYRAADFNSVVTDKVVDKVDVTDRIESAKVDVTDRRPVLADSGATDSDVTDKPADIVDVTDRMRVVTDRRPVMANRGVTDNDVADKMRVVTDKVADIVDVTDRMRVVAAISNVAALAPAKPQQKWPPPKGWVWNPQSQSYEPPAPTVHTEPMDQELIRQTLHVSPNLQYVPGKGLVSIHELPTMA